jgi:hypothetical protein
MEMQKNAEMKKWIVKVLIVIAVIASLMLTMHVLVNNFNLLGFLRSMHGG